MNGLSLTAIIGSGVAIIGLIINMMRAGKDSATRNIEEGQRREKLSILEKDVDNLYAKIRYIETEYSGLKTDIAEMKSDIKHILEAIGELRDKREYVKTK